MASEFESGRDKCFDDALCTKLTAESRFDLALLSLDIEEWINSRGWTNVCELTAARDIQSIASDGAAAATVGALEGGKTRGVEVGGGSDDDNGSSNDDISSR